MTYARGLVARAVPGPLLVAAILVALLASQGGYFPPSWGWSSVLLLVVIGAWAILTQNVSVTRGELAWLGAIAALVVWTALSAIWSPDTGASLLEAQRALLYLVAIAAVLALARTFDARALLLAILVAVVVISAYSLSTRLFPGHFGIVDTTAGYRLATPIGYWNGLGILAAMGALVALAVVAEEFGPAVRAAAAGSAVVFVLTIYYTFSRASWVALGLGFVVMALLTKRHLRLVSRTALASVAPALGLIYAVRLHALNAFSPSTGIGVAARQGRHLAVAAFGLAVLGALLSLALTALEERVTVPPRVHRLLGLAFVAGILLVVAGGFVAVGKTPGQIVSKAYRSFKVETPSEGQDLNKRLLSFSGNGRIDLWRVAWKEYTAHPVLGSGAGTYERYWLAYPRSSFYVRDAHGLYIEVLAELGPIGLALLLLVLLAPLAVAVRKRGSPMVALAAGAYVAYVVHTGVDWDWELGAVTLTALLIGAVIFVGTRDPQAASSSLGPVPRGAILVAVVALSVAAGASYLGNAASANADTNLRAGRFAAAALDAKRAHTLEPWSTTPELQLAEADLGTGDFAGARRALAQALRQDPGNWETWLDLGLASNGAARARALAHARRLYPTSQDIILAQKYDAKGSVAASVESRSSRRKRVSGQPAPTK